MRFATLNWKMVYSKNLAIESNYKPIWQAASHQKKNIEIVSLCPLKSKMNGD
jgi:hypothetical protein